MLKLVRLRSRTHTSWIISCLRQRFCVEIGFFTARILSTRHARRDAWRVTQGVVGNSWVGHSTEPPLPVRAGHLWYSHPLSRWRLQSAGGSYHRHEGGELCRATRSGGWPIVFWSMDGQSLLSQLTHWSLAHGNVYHLRANYKRKAWNYIYIYATLNWAFVLNFFHCNRI